MVPYCAVECMSLPLGSLWLRRLALGGRMHLGVGMTRSSIRVVSWCRVWLHTGSGRVRQTPTSFLPSIDREEFFHAARTRCGTTHRSSDCGHFRCGDRLSAKHTPSGHEQPAADSMAHSNIRARSSEQCNKARRGTIGFVDPLVALISDELMLDSPTRCTKSRFKRTARG
jgi:hypothetical protein